jgi:transcriptional regulator with XRE-family HTH domain
LWCISWFSLFARQLVWIYLDARSRSLLLASFITGLRGLWRVDAVAIGPPVPMVIANIYRYSSVYCDCSRWDMLAAVFSPLCLRLPDPVTATFAKRLKEARAMRGLSQRALGGIVTGDKAKGSVRINRYEQEVNRADMETAATLARTLDVPLAYLFAEEDDQAELLLAFAQLTKAERSQILGEVRKMVAGNHAGTSKSGTHTPPRKA